MLANSIERLFFCQRFTPHQLSKDNRHIVLLLFLMFLHAKDIWCNIHSSVECLEVDISKNKFYKMLF